MPAARCWRASPPRERRILAMRVYGRMSQAEIAAEVGLSQMHVSRLLKQTLDRLRTPMPLRAVRAASR